MITGYTSTTSVRPGATIAFHLRSDEPTAERELTVEKIGGDPVSRTLSVLVARDDGRRPSETWLGFDWPATASLRVPPDWPSGMYKLRHGDQQILSFVVRAARPGATSQILFQISHLTPAAYNTAGGKSFYSPTDNGQRARKVSLQRPGSSPRVAHGDSTTPHIREAKFLDWLGREGIAVECCSSIDLHAVPDLLDHYSCLIIGWHDEYWTKPMRDRCEQFVANGCNLIVLSGNTCYRQVRLEDDDQTVVFYKFAGLDPHPHRDETAVAWASPPVNRPQNSLLGVGFTEGAFTQGGRGNYRVRFPDHWVFDGVSTEVLPMNLSYETDAAAYVDEPEGYPRVTGEEDTPLSTTVLATADLRDWPGKPGRATMTLHSRSGQVFNAATTEWLDQVGSDPVTTRITRNVIDRLRSVTVRDWELVGHARNGRALAGASGRLFIATDDNKLWRRHPVGADVEWTEIGHANGLVAMAGGADRLYCVTTANQLWVRPTTEEDHDWRLLGEGPSGGTRALAVVGGMLYAIDRGGTLMERATDGSVANWRPVRRTFAPHQIDPNPTITSMVSYGDMLLATTSGNRLVRTDTDWINESGAWEDIHHCNHAIGLAVVEWMLYVATSDNRLWRMDLWGLRDP